MLLSERAERALSGGAGVKPAKTTAQLPAQPFKIRGSGEAKSRTKRFFYFYFLKTRWVFKLDPHYSRKRRSVVI